MRRFPRYGTLPRMNREFANALEQQGPLVAAWDRLGKTDETWRLSLFTLAGDAPDLIAGWDVPLDDRQEVEDDLWARRIPVGFHGRECDHLWVRESARFRVWNADGLACTVDEQHVRPTQGKPVKRSQIRQAVAFGDRYENGVFLETAPAGRVVVATRESETAGDPFATRTEIVYHSMWTSLLARQLADWLGVPHDYRIDDSD